MPILLANAYGLVHSDVTEVASLQVEDRGVIKPSPGKTPLSGKLQAEFVVSADVPLEAENGLLVAAGESVDNDRLLEIAATGKIYGRIWAENASNPIYVRTVFFDGYGAVPPTLSVDPSIAGTAQVGEELTGTDGTYVGDKTIVVGSYQWQSTDDLEPESGPIVWTDIAGATSADFTITAAEEDLYLRRGEVASNSAGSAARAYSDPTTIVLAAA
jgi:hypothetical protein